VTGTDSGAGSATDSADRLLEEVVAGHFMPRPPARIGVAVSGGGDSVALLVLMHRFLGDCPNTSLHVVTVDHGLRPEATAEARGVAALAASMGLSHDTLIWSGWDGTGNLQDEARRGRYDLIETWAADRGITAVALGHTADDQAETVLMRLARASGVDGLSGMAPRRRMGRIELLRPMLALRRADLRAFLRRNGLTWAEDPSNDDESYDRIRARAALKALEPLGVTVPALCTTGRNLSAIRETLDWYAFTEARTCVTIDRGDVVIEMRHLRILRHEILRRILLNALLWLTGTEHGPRRKAMELFIEAIRAGGGMTLHGCRAVAGRGQLRLCREWAAVSGLTAEPGALWDGRWRLTGPFGTGCEIAALGEAGLNHCPGWRDTGIPRVSLLASPAVWRDGRLIAAPLAGRVEGWQARLERPADAFFAAFLAQGGAH